MREVALSSFQNVVVICKQIAILILYQVSSRLVNLHKFISSSICVPNVLVLSVYCKIINFVFQIFPLCS
jgi:hypothetical protein